MTLQDDSEKKEKDTSETEPRNIPEPSGTFKKVKVMTIKNRSCKHCNTPITDNNKILKCKECGLDFCEQCEKQILKEETFYDGYDNRQLHSDYPLCENCYQINLNKQKELHTMHRRFLQLRETLPAEPEVWFSTAERFMDSELFNLARLCYNEAINIDENIANKVSKAWGWAGVKLLKELRYQDALECFDEALSLNENSESCWLNRSECLEHIERFSDAIVSLDKILQKNPNNLEVLCRKGLLLAKMNDPNSSRKCFIKAVNLNPSNEMTWLYKLKTHSMFNEYPEIIKCADYILNVNPNNELAWKAKSNGLIKLNDLPAALQFCDNFIKRQPMNPIGWKCKGDILIKLGKFEEAIMIYDKALTLDLDGAKINLEEVQNNIQIAKNNLKNFIPIPDWLKDGSNISYDYSEYQNKEKHDNFDIKFEIGTAENVVIIETYPSGETQRITLEGGLNNTLNGDIIHKYWFGSTFNEKEKIKDMDDKEFVVKGLEQIGTVLGPIKCWRLEFKERKDEGKIKINSWFDSRSGLLIKKVYNERLKNKQPEHWAIKVKDSNIPDLKVEEPLKMAPRDIKTPEPVPKETETLAFEVIPELKSEHKEPPIPEEKEYIKRIEEEHKQKLEEEKGKFEEEIRKIQNGQKNLEEEKARFEEDKQKIQKEMQSLEEEKVKLEKERWNFEEERRRKAEIKKKIRREMDAKRTREEEEKLKYEEERRRFESEKQKIKKHLQVLQEERQKLEEEKGNFEEERKRKIEKKKKIRREIDEKRIREEEERLKYEEERRRFESEKQKIQNGMEQVEKEKQKLENERIKFEEEQELRVEKEKILKRQQEEKREREEEEKKKYEEEKQKFEEEKQRIQEDIQGVQHEKQKLDMIKRKINEDRISKAKEQEKLKPNIGEPKTISETIDKKEMMPIESKKKKSKKKKTIIITTKKKRRRKETIEPPQELPVEVKPISDKLPSYDELNQLYNEISQQKEPSEIEKKKMIKIIQGYYRTLKIEFKKLEDSGTDISHFLPLFKNALDKLREKDHLGTLKLIIKITKEKKDLESPPIEKEILEMSKKIEEAAKLYPTASATGAFSKAKKELANNNLEEAQTLILDSQKLLTEYDKHYLKAKEIIEIVDQKIQIIKSSGINIEEPMKIFLEMKSAFESNRYLELQNLKSECLIAIEKSRIEYGKVLDQIGLAQKKCNQLRKQKVSNAASEDALKEAKVLLIAGSYIKASEHANNSIELAENALEQVNDLAKKLQEMEDIDWGKKYLLIEKKPILGFTIQHLLSEQNVSSITISPETSKQLLKKFNFKPDKSLWLTDRGDKDSVSPSDLAIITNEIVQFIKGSEMSIVLIHGFELLLKENSLENVLEFLDNLNVVIKDNYSILIVILNPKNCSENEIEKIRPIGINLEKVDLGSISNLQASYDDENK